MSNYDPTRPLVQSMLTTQCVNIRGQLLNLPILSSRFTKEAKEGRHPCTYMPFGQGPRNCVGMRFAILESKMILISILRKYNIELLPETPVRKHKCVKYECATSVTIAIMPARSRSNSYSSLFQFLINIS